MGAENGLSSNNQIVDFTNAKEFILSKLKEELSKELIYHDVAHTLDVYEAVLKHIDVSDVSKEDSLILQTAAFFHDSGFIRQTDGHEGISCDYALEYLPLFGYSLSQIQTICGMIMATKIPQDPCSPLEEILADADLDYLGRDDFFVIANKLYLELRAAGVVTNEDDWNRVQIDFFEGHHYFTPAAKTWREQKKAQHLAILKSKIKE